MIALPRELVEAFEQWLRFRWFDACWYVRRGSLCCSFGLLGLRWCEVERLRPGDLLPEERRLFVRTGKRGHPRTIEGPQGLLQAAVELRAGVVQGDDRVFTTRGGRGMVYQDVRRFVGSATSAVFGRAFSFHCFRHTAAVRVYERTHDVVAVQRLLGHKSLHWTNAYLRSLVPADTGGPAAFCGGEGERPKPKLFDPEGMLMGKFGKSGAAGDGVACEGDLAASRGVPPGRRPGGSELRVDFADHSCGKHLVPARYGSEGGRAWRCTRCGSLWSDVGELLVDGVAREKEVKAAMQRSESPRFCQHQRTTDTWCQKVGGYARVCQDCGKWLGYVRAGRRR